MERPGGSPTLAAAAAAFGYGSPPPRTSVLQGRGKMGASPTSAGSVRPLTSTKAAGYSALGPGSTPSSPLSPSAKPGSALLRDQCAALEERVHAALEAAAERLAGSDAPGAVDAAKEAARKEQRLCAALEGAGAGDQVSLDLKYAVSVGLAAAYEANGQANDALAVYTQVLKSRLFPQARVQWLDGCGSRADAVMGCPLACPPPAGASHLAPAKTARPPRLE